jgi:hypothetical protein
MKRTSVRAISIFAISVDLLILIGALAGTAYLYAHHHQFSICALIAYLLSMLAFLFIGLLFAILSFFLSLDLAKTAWEGEYGGTAFRIENRPTQENLLIAGKVVAHHKGLSVAPVLLKHSISTPEGVKILSIRIWGLLSVDCKVSVDGTLIPVHEVPLEQTKEAQKDRA